MPFKQGTSGNPATMYKPGQSGNPNGRKPGLKNWSTLVQEVLADDAIIDKLLAGTKKKAPAWFESISDKRAGYVIILAMVTRAISGDEKCATWLRKTGYGDKMNFGTDGEQPIMPLMMLNMNPPIKRKATNAKGNKPKAKRSIRTGSKPKGKKA